MGLLEGLDGAEKHGVCRQSSGSALPRRPRCSTRLTAECFRTNRYFEREAGVDLRGAHRHHRQGPHRHPLRSYDFADHGQVRARARLRHRAGQSSGFDPGSAHGSAADRDLRAAPSASRDGRRIQLAPEPSRHQGHGRQRCCVQQGSRPFPDPDGQEQLGVSCHGRSGSDRVGGEERIRIR